MRTGVGKLNDSLENNEEYWPDRIIAQKSITYDVLRIREELQQLNDSKATLLGEEPEQISFEEVLDLIYEYVKDDFSCGWGHEANMRDIMVFDPDGEEY